MKEHDSIGRRRVRKDAGSQRAGTPVLLAAVSLLGTSLGVSAATPVDPIAPTAKHATPRPTFDRLARGAHMRKTQLFIPKQVKSNQVKQKTQSDQIKLQSRQIKDCCNRGVRGR